MSVRTSVQFSPNATDQLHILQSCKHRNFRKAFRVVKTNRCS